jgi:hypothetical protein
MLEPTLRYQRFTRRASGWEEGTTKCTNGSWHDAVTLLDVVTLDSHDSAITYTDGAIPGALRMSLPFPAACRCGYAFTEADMFQYGHKVVMRDACSGQEYTRFALPIGAMWHAPWMSRFPEHNHANDPKGPLIVRLPGNYDWNTDGPDKKGGYWTREGMPPKVTVTPSIAVPGYHGYLTNGVLTNDLEGRTIAPQAAL